MMTYTLRLKRTYRPTQSGAIAKIGVGARAVASEHTLALRAAEKAASHRQSVAEVRAMYVPPYEPPSENDAVEPTTKPDR